MMSAAGRKGGMNPLLAGGLVVACLLLVVGCSTPEARHEVLTFFFTGVPDPEQAGEYEEGLAMSAAERREARLWAERRANFREPSKYAHGPAAANQCTRCHKALPGAGANSRRIGPVMVSGIKDLCTGCHNDKDRAFAESQAMVSHPLAGEGLCVQCHDPHRADLPYMLKGTDRAGLCLSCHAEDKPAGAPRSAVHRKEPGRDCIACHNPHFGKTPMLLKADFDEWQIYEMDLARAQVRQ